MSARSSSPRGDRVAQMDAWLAAARDALADASGVPRDELALGAGEQRILLDLARVAAHTSGERTNAPLLCYLLGVARRGAPLENLADAVDVATRRAR